MSFSPLLAGAGFAEITFPDGYFPGEEFQAEHDSLGARVVVLSSGVLRTTIVSFELPSIRPFELIDDFRSYIGELTSTPPENVWVSVTHNVSAPHVPRPEHHNGIVRREMHLEAARTAAKKAALQAVEDMRPAKTGSAYGTCDINANRDICCPGGWFVGVGGDGPSDKTTTVLSIRDMEDRPIAILYSYAVKSAVIEYEVMSDGKRYSTHELSGVASRLLEEEFGAPALYFMGAAADQNPKVTAFHKVYEDGTLKEIHLREEGFRLVEKYGTQLAKDISSTVHNIACYDRTPVMECTVQKFMLPGQRIEFEHPPVEPVTELEYLPDVDQELLAHVIRIGDMVILGLKPEITCVTGTALRDRCPAPYLMIADMVNGGQGYLPDEREYGRHIYEAYHAPFAQGAAERFVEEMTIALTEIVRK